MRLPTITEIKVSMLALVFIFFPMHYGNIPTLLVVVVQGIAGFIGCATYLVAIDRQEQEINKRYQTYQMYQKYQKLLIPLVPVILVVLFLQSSYLFLIAYLI